MKKKILSIILAISMIVSLVPVISASAEGETPYQLVYDFKNIDSTYVGGLTSSKLTPELGFNHTEGTWAFHSWNGLDGDTVTYKPNYGIEIKSNSVGDYFAVKINVPYAGDYIPSLTYFEQNTGVDDDYVAADVYVLPEDSDVSTAEDSDKIIIADGLLFNKNGGKNTDKDLAEYKKDTPIKLSSGENILVFEVTGGPGGHAISRMRPGVLTLTSGTLADGESYATVPMYISKVSASDAEFETGDSTALTVSGWMNDGTAFTEASDSVSFDSSSENISIDGNTVTASAAGAAAVTATVTSGEKSLSKDISITVNPTAQEKADAAFTVSKEETKYTAPTVASFTYDGASVTAEKNEDGYYDITAPETKNGEKFLYWAKGLTTQKRIISFSNKLENYVPDDSGTNYLIAVYEDKLPTIAEYYNANGQLIPGAKDSDRPYMAGYGTASGWKQYGETNIWVAEYNNKTQPDNVTVTVENGTGTATLPYGEKVTCNANEAEEGTYFRWWQKDVNGAPEIVSVDEEYSFLAYENCKVTAVYGDTAVNVTNPAKIIIDTFGENSVMAEFIGFGSNVVEKGIMWNNNKIAMTAPGNQFTVTADKNGTFKGYAIISEGESYKLIIDGEAEIRGLAE
ncbi:MAG: hypothetical protein IJF32_00820 [Oscillospiraceae bacterium]|nr:hypothetical protein [Oscillospiraceae bacterium]